MVVGRTSAHTRFHGGGQPVVLSLGQGKPRTWNAVGLPHLNWLQRDLVLELLT